MLLFHIYTIFFPSSSGEVFFGTTDDRIISLFFFKKGMLSGVPFLYYTNISVLNFHKIPNFLFCTIVLLVVL